MGFFEGNKTKRLKPTGGAPPCAFRSVQWLLFLNEAFTDLSPRLFPPVQNREQPPGGVAAATAAAAATVWEETADRQRASLMKVDDRADRLLPHCSTQEVGCSTSGFVLGNAMW